MTYKHPQLAIIIYNAGDIITASMNVAIFNENSEDYLDWSIK